MSEKRIVIVKSSPRKNGNSSFLAEQVAAGAKAAGAEVESFDLHEMTIRPCTACDVCQETIEAECVIQDDMQILYPKLRSADALVIASPVYYFTLCAQVKLFIDRGFYALGGFQGHALAGKQIGIILTYADTDPFTSGAINALRAFQDIFHFIRADIVGIVYGSAWRAGEIQNQGGLIEKAYQLGQQLGTDLL
jgi:multimeric flavodoxin WrbA